MKVVLGKFARTGIEARLGCDVTSGVRTALRHYTQRPEPEPGLPALPRFSRERLPASTGEGLELALEPEVEEALVQEARPRGVSVEQLASHAVLFYLADMDRVAAVETRQLTHL